jgi:hypothetical protein
MNHNYENDPANDLMMPRRKDSPRWLHTDNPPPPSYVHLERRTFFMGILGLIVGLIMGLNITGM